VTSLPFYFLNPHILRVFFVYLVIINKKGRVRLLVLSNDFKIDNVYNLSCSQVESIQDGCLKEEGFSWRMI
jgi:hypothetical protein